MKEILKHIRDNEKKYSKITSVMEFMLIISVLLMACIGVLKMLINMGDLEKKTEVIEKQYDFVLNGNFLNMKEYDMFKKTAENEVFQKSSVLRKAELILNEAEPDNIFPDMLKYKGDEKIYLKIYAVGEREYLRYINFLNLEYDDIKDSGILINYTSKNIQSDIFKKIVDSGKIEGYLNNKKYEIPLGLLSHEKPFALEETGLALIVSDELYNQYFEQRIVDEENEYVSYLDRNDRYFSIIDFQIEKEGINTFDRANLQIYYKTVDETNIEEVKDEIKELLQGLKFRIDDESNSIEEAVETVAEYIVVGIKWLVEIAIAIMLLIGFVVVIHVEKKSSKANIDRMLNKDSEKAQKEYDMEKKAYLFLGVKMFVTTILYTCAIILGIASENIYVILTIMVALIAYIPVKIALGNIKIFVLETVVLLPIYIYACIFGLSLDLQDILLPGIYIVVVIAVSIFYEKKLIFKACDKNQHKIEVYDKK